MIGATNTANIAPLGSDLSIDSQRAGASLGGTAGDSVAFLKPFRGGDGSLNAIAARRAGRLNAASVKEREVESLLTERQSLIKKKFAGGLSRGEDRRLALVRWNLDRIQDARHGETLDALEAAVSLYESIGNDIAHLMRELEVHAPKGRRR